MEKNPNSLSELLAEDKDAKAFFDGLSPELRHSLMQSDLSNFKALQKSVQSCGKCHSTENDLQYLNPACSFNDCTGLIPKGGDKSISDYNEYQEIYPFGNPH